VPERELQAEGHRLGMHTMRAAHHRRVPMLFGARTNGVEEAFDILEKQIGRLAHLNSLRGVDDVGGGEPEMQPARGRPDVLGNDGRKGDDVVLCGFFDGGDAGDVELRFLPDSRAASWGMMPASAIASAAAISTCNQVSNLRSSLQMRPISGCV
jgi:hypothetical protein